MLLIQKKKKKKKTPLGCLYLQLLIIEKSDPRHQHEMQLAAAFLHHYRFLRLVVLGFSSSICFLSICFRILMAPSLPHKDRIRID